MDDVVKRDSSSAGTDSIRSSARVLRRDWWIIGVLGAIAGAISCGAALLQTPMYESTATLYVTSGSDANSQTAYQGGLASQQRVLSYAELAKSDSVLNDARNESAPDLSLEEVSQALSTSTSEETVLLSISATLPDQNQAAALANAVANSSARYVRDLETPVGGELPLTKLTVVTPAEPADSPVSPSVVRASAIGIIVGTSLGLIIVILRHRFDTRVRSADELESLSVLSTISFDESLAIGQISDFRQGAGGSTEGYRKLRTNMGFVTVDRPARTIMVTSPGAGDGKTTTAANLAAALAEAGNEVLVIGADLRRPALAARISASSGIGLTTLLSGAADLSDVIQRSQVDGLDVLACGPVPPNPAELLASRRFADLLHSLRERYDYTILDSAPMLPVADSAVIAKLVDGVVLVVRCNQTKREGVFESVSQLELGRANFLGVVLNAAEKGNARTYGYDYRASSTKIDLPGQAVGTP